MFGDASTQGVGAAVYSVVRQRSGITQRLIAAKARLAKQGLAIPRLELVSAHVATNLVTNVRNALQGLPEPTIHGWLDSTVALHWICGNGQCNQFVENRVRKIREHPGIQWRHVPTQDNPADLASHGGPVTELTLWWNGPEWLQNPDKWPENPVCVSSSASEAEAKVIKNVLCMAQAETTTDTFEVLLVEHPLRHSLRIHAWIERFLQNCRNENKLSGPLNHRRGRQQPYLVDQACAASRQHNTRLRADKGPTKPTSQRTRTSRMQRKNPREVSYILAQ